MPSGALREALAAYPGAPVLVVDGTEASPLDGGEIVVVARVRGRRVLVACVPQGSAERVAAEIGPDRARCVAPAGDQGGRA